jgi:hypothetical protein
VCVCVCLSVCRTVCFSVCLSVFVSERECVCTRMYLNVLLDKIVSVLFIDTPLLHITSKLILFVTCNASLSNAFQLIWISVLIFAFVITDISKACECVSVSACRLSIQATVKILACKLIGPSKFAIRATCENNCCCKLNEP